MHYIKLGGKESSNCTHHHWLQPPAISGAVAVAITVANGCCCSYMDIAVALIVSDWTRYWSALKALTSQTLLHELESGSSIMTCVTY